jgi:hypothetical protein
MRFVVVMAREIFGPGHPVVQARGTDVDFIVLTREGLPLSFSIFKRSIFDCKYGTLTSWHGRNFILSLVPLRN